MFMVQLFFSIFFLKILGPSRFIMIGTNFNSRVESRKFYYEDIILKLQAIKTNCLHRIDFVKRYTRVYSTY